MDKAGLSKNHSEKNTIKKLKKSKHQNQIAACKQKITIEKANVCPNTVLSLILKLDRKISRFDTARFFVPLPVSA